MTIVISSKREGFRRCGRAFTKNATAFADGIFTEDELAVLKAEPMLTVGEVEDEAKSPALADMTVSELKTLCGRLDIPYPSNAKKQDLIEAVELNTAEPAEA